MGVAIKSLCGDDLSYDQMFCWSDKKMFLNLTRSSHRRCSLRKGSLKFGKIHKKKLVLASFFIKLRLEACNFIEKEALAQVLSCKFCEFLRTPFLQNTSGQMLLLDE